MESKEQKARTMAARFHISKRGNEWVVPSETRKTKFYRVSDQEPRTCTCEDYGLHLKPCKHILAVKYKIEWGDRPPELPEENEPEGPKPNKPRKPRNWRAYNEAQVRQRAHFRVLLRDLCDHHSPALEPKVGRRRLPWSDIVFFCADKVFSTLSTRRYMEDCFCVLERTDPSRTLHYNTVSRHLANPGLTPILLDLIQISATPFQGYEIDFSIDGTGISKHKYRRWFHERDQVMKAEHEWTKLHLICGNETKIVAAVIVTESHDHDNTFLPALLQQLVERFRVRRLCADKAYLCEENLKAIDEVGAVPVIPFKDHCTPRLGGIWRKMYFKFQYNRDEFLRHYHRRSNVESAFAAIKGLFGERVRSKTDPAMQNEVLLKVLCHNICVLIRSHYELGFPMEYLAPKLEPPPTCT